MTTQFPNRSLILAAACAVGIASVPTSPAQQGVETEDIGIAAERKTQDNRYKSRPARLAPPSRVIVPSETIAAALRAYLGGCDVRIDGLKTSQGYKLVNDSWVRCPTSLSPLEKTKFALGGAGVKLSYDYKAGKTRRYAPNNISSENIGVAAKTASWMTSNKKTTGFCTNCAHFLITINFESDGNEIKGFFPWPEGRKIDAPWDIAMDNLKLNIYASMKSTRSKNDPTGDSLLFEITDVDLFAEVKTVGGHGGNLLGSTTIIDDIFEKHLKKDIENSIKNGINNSAFARNFDDLLKAEFLAGENAVNAVASRFKQLGIAVRDLRFDEQRDAIVLLAK